LPLFGNHPLRLSALQARQIDGTVMAMPYNKMAVKMGFRELVERSYQDTAGRISDVAAENPQRARRGFMDDQSVTDGKSVPK